MDTITTEVPTSEGDVMVTTKARAFFIFNRPHTSVMPVGLSRFGMKLGFQAWYNTAEPPVLEDLHWFFVEEIAGGNFKSMLANAKVGVIDIPPDYERLRHYIVGFKRLKNLGHP